MSFSFVTSNTFSYDTFYREAMTHGEGDFLAFSFFLWFEPKYTLAELKTLVAPLFQAWKDFEIEFNGTESEHESHYGTQAAGFPSEVVGGSKTETAGRLFPTENFQDAAKFNKSFDVLKSLSDKGGQIIGFGITGGPGPYPDKAVNPAWRGSAMWAISVIVTDQVDGVLAQNGRLLRILNT
ncbi:hypothetical protein FGADI_1926 [Fusarium gaditjirri]|uniref:Uncharacterized protein n=1 Tax=Fusarium gaditjirri TaxID=282569 RepID=A0A8H4TJK1_9HYPO|nr:hypothetical protein FGADI_1926 [Fusarium gaditjirri]